MDIAFLKDLDPLNAAWVLLAWVIIGLFRGTIVTRREAEALREEAEMSREALKEALRQNTLLLTSTAPVVETTFQAIRDSSRGGDPR